MTRSPRVAERGLVRSQLYRLSSGRDGPVGADDVPGKAHDLGRRPGYARW